MSQLLNILRDVWINEKQNKGTSLLILSGLVSEKLLIAQQHTIILTHWGRYMNPEFP